MANARLIWKEFFTSADLLDLNANGRLLFAGMIVYANNSGEIRHNLPFFQNTILAGLRLRPWRILRLLDHLHRRGCLELKFFDERAGDWVQTETLTGGVPDGVEFYGSGSDAVLMRFSSGSDAVLMRFPCGSDAVLERFSRGNPEVISVWKIRNFSRFQPLNRIERNRIEKKRIEARAKEVAKPPQPETRTEPKPQGEIPGADEVFARLLSEPFKFGSIKARSILERFAPTSETLNEWLRYEQTFGTAAMIANIQRYRLPSEIPERIPSNISKPAPTSQRVSSFNDPNKFKQ